MDDKTILGRIHDLVDEEHKLRARVQAGEISTDEEHQRLQSLEDALDQCWNLLRRRRAARAAGVDAAAIDEYLSREVEGYVP